MSWLDGMRHRLRSVLGARAYQEELEEEMRFHLELDAVQQGDADEARRRFGNRTWYAEEVRRTTWLRHVDALRQDLGYAWRAVVRTPGVTAVVVVTLSLGIGVNAAIFSVLDAIYLRPPAGISEPESLRRIWIEDFATSDGAPFTSPSINYPMYRAIAAGMRDPAMLALYRTDVGLRLGARAGAPKVRGAYATASYFSVLGVRPALGRIYTADEDSLGRGAPVAVVSDAFWRHRLGGDSAVLGSRIALGTDEYTIIGVLRPEFAGLELSATDLWIPLGAMPAPVRDGKPWWEIYGSHRYRAIQRLLPGERESDLEHRATAGVRAVDWEMRREFADSLARAHFGPIIYARGPDEPAQELVISTRLGGVAAIVLVIACANVVNLLLARAVRRRREIALRLALGISRGRLVRLLTVETILLASIAGAAALLAGWWGGNLLRSLLMPDVAWAQSAMHWRVALFTIGVTLAAGLVAGIVPAVQASDPGLVGALKDGAQGASTHRSRLRSALVVTQAALSVMLLVGATLFVRSLEKVKALDIGFDSDRLLFGYVHFVAGDRPTSAVVDASLREIVQRLESRPGIEVVARAGNEPMQGFSMIGFFTDTDSSATRKPEPTMSAVSPAYFRATGIRMLRGRAFTDRNVREGPAELVVDEATARVLWPGRDAIGQCIRFMKRDSGCYRVVGIVENTRRDGVIEEEPVPQYYLPVGDTLVAGWLGGDIVIVRARPEAASAAAGELRTALHDAFPAAEAKVTSMTENLEPEYRPWRLGATLFTAFGLLALAVTLVGIYSTVSYGVSQRTHEFGVRIALGARIGDVLRQVVGEGVRTVAIGVAVGIVLALAAGRLVAALLYDISPSDPAVMLLVALILLAVAALAAVIPAWRAARVDPVTALRSE